MELAKAASSSKARAAGLAPATIKSARAVDDVACNYYAEATHFVTHLGLRERSRQWTCASTNRNGRGSGRVNPAVRSDLHLERRERCRCRARDHGSSVRGIKLGAVARANEKALP